MKKNKLNILKNEKLKIERDYKKELLKKVAKCLNGVTLDADDGKTLPQIATGVFEKKYIAQKELKLVYDCIRVLRKNSDYCLAYRNGFYGWAHDKVTIDNYRLSNVQNGLMKLKSNVMAIQKNYEVEGIIENPFIPLQEKCKEFGVRMLDYIG